MIALWILAFAPAVPAGTFVVTEPRCEYSVAPLGIDELQPRLSWKVASEQRGERQTAYQIVVASSREILAQDRGDLWDSGRTESDQTTLVHYAGRALASSQQVFWKVRSWNPHGEATAWSEPATWTMGVLKAADWKARWIVAPWTSEALLLRRDFTVKPALRRALLHISGLGQYEVAFNGRKAGQDLLSPGWTNYDETVLYDTRDVTALLNAGSNAIGVTLGNGMYNVVRRDRFAKFTGSFGPLRLIAQLELEYADGTRELVGSDDQWRVHRGGITYNSIYGGEDFDARLMPVDWDRPGFDDREWSRAVHLIRPAGQLRGHAFSAEPLAPIERLAPVSVRPLRPGVVLYDFGQNASFMPRIRVRGPAGASVRLTPGEVVNADGSIDRGTMGGAHRGSAWWQFTKAGDGEEEWFPQFYYVGSRYLSVELRPPAGGDDRQRPELTFVESVVVHSVAQPVGRFVTSNALLNRIRDLVRWAQRSNMVSILTDCPHREKLGWIEQYHLNGPSIRYEFDVARIYTKGMRDMAAAQTADGLVPNITPEFTEFKGAFRGAAEWGAAFILVPWQQYQFAGDVELLRTHYPAMKRYFGYLESRAKESILSDGLGDWYDYAPGTGKRANLTPPPITATAFFYEDAQTLARIADVLGEPADAKHFADRAAEIKRAYVAKFRRPADGLYGTVSQASLAIPLAMQLVDEADRAAVTAALVSDVERLGYASAGDIGFRYLLRALADAGRSDVVYRLINQDEKPGYGYQLKEGATALAESWHASGEASHNHFMLGQVIEWFYHDLAGIASDPAGPGFKKILIKPAVVGDLGWVDAEYESVRGPIGVRWDRQGDRLKLAVRIPANTTATVAVPARPGSPVVESGQPVEQAAGVKLLRREGDRVFCEIESGNYVFESTL